jgi:hypothetical protein
MKLKYIILVLLILTQLSPLSASCSTGESLAKEMNLMAGYKAIIQWERIFKSKKKMKRYKIDKLSSDERNCLKEYLIKHAIDSDHPTVAGVY